MALDRELRRLLEYANLPETENSSSKDVAPPRPTARGILDRLIGIYQQTCVPSMGVSADMNLPELLVLTAEAALFQADFNAALESVEWFFSVCQLKNQFYCRAQFVRARCGSHDAQSYTGVMKLKKVLNAIHFILAVIPIATDTRKRPTYDFLVYNGSVMYWQIARQLMKQSTFQFLAQSLEKIIDALKLTAEADIAWLLRLQIALVYAQVDANQLANAAKTINDIVDVQIAPRLTDPAKAANESFKALYEEALRIQVHVGSFKDPECQKILPSVKRLLPPTYKRPSLLVKLQCIKSGNLTGSLEAAYVEIFQEATDFLAFAAETGLDEVKKFVESLEPRALDAIDAEVIVETAIHAALSNSLQTAGACDIVLQRKGKNIPPKTRVLCQVLSAILVIVMPGTHSGKLSRINTRQRHSMLLARRVEGVKAIERALLASKRQQDPDLVERVCIYAWNLSLPLVQPHLRNHLTRMFGLSSSILEELNSLLLGFRARLYLETAKLEVASDFLAKASTNIAKGISLDYGTIVRPNEASPVTIELLSAHEDWIARPVDTHLLPVKQKLDLKLLAESSPSKLIEVLAMLEQAKDGKDPEQQRSTLARCVEMMTEISSTLEISAVADHVRLWSEISSLAWSGLHDGNLAQQAVETALATYFSPNEAGESVLPKTISGEKCLMVLEIDMRLLLVEILAAHLKGQATQFDNARRKADPTGIRNEAYSQTGGISARRRPSIDLATLVLLGKEAYMLGMHRAQTEGSSSPMNSTTERGEMDENAHFQSRQYTLKNEIQTAKSEILSHLTIALKAATRIGWTFVLENTCIYVWNYHFHIFRMVLESSRVSTGSATDAFDPQWIMPECVSAFEMLYAALEAASTEVDSDLLANVGFGLSSIYEKTGRLDKAVAIADTFLKRKPTVSVDSSGVSVLHLKRLAELKSRVQIAQNAKDIVPTDSSTAQLKVVAYLEAMEVTFRQMLLPAVQQAQLLEKAQGFHQKAMAMWQTCAPEISNAFMSDEFEREIEEEQRQTELYVEVWARVGCGAFRLRNVRYAIECAEQALSVLSPGKSRKAKQMAQLLVVGSTWKWFSLAELLYGRAILALDQGETFAQKILLASLAHLVRAIEYGLRGNMATLVIQASEVVWNATIAATNRNGRTDSDEYDEDHFQDRIVEHLRKTLRYLDQVIDSPEADLSFYGEMVLLTLSVCEKANKWSDQFEICETVLKDFGPTSHRTPLPRNIMKEIQTASAISGAHLGKPSSVQKSGGSSKSPDQMQESLVQAQILKKVAFSSWKDPPAQLKVLSNAYIELDGQTEEQTLVLIDIAEWIFTNQLPSQDADVYLECASSTLLSCQKQKLGVSQAAMTRKGSTGQLFVASRQKPNKVYSPLWFDEKLLRIFVMRATLSQTHTARSNHVRLALYEVEKAWEHIILMANTIEFRTAFDRENADPSIGFDEWKKDKAPRYVKPASKRDWVYFLDYDENAANRFYVPWTKVLQSVQTPNTIHITQPVLTLAYLEDLLTMLHDDGLQYLSMIPVFCLYAVLFHAYVPQRTYIAQIWLELSQFDLMERLNMSNYSLPLQSALDMIQAHGDTLIKDLQDAETSNQNPECGFVSRKRQIFHSDRLDTRIKAVASILLLIKFGFVRQAKSLLEILRYLVESNSADGNNNFCSTEVFSEYEFLSSHILEIEGQSELALARINTALECPRLDVCRLMKWTLRSCKLNPDLDESLRQLKHTEKKVAEAVVAALRRPGSSSRTPNSSGAAAYSPPDIEVVQLMAQIVFKQSKLLLKKAVASEGSNASVLLQESKCMLEKSMQMLTIIEGEYCRSQLLQKYSRALILFEQCHGALQLTGIGLETTDMLQTALTLQKICFARQCEFHSMQTETREREVVVVPLGLSIALTELQFARLLMIPEMSSTAIKEKEMTWYRFYDDSQLTIVEKWLSATGSVLKKDFSVALPRAMTLLTSAIEVLSSNAVFEIQHAIAQVLKFQCQRVALFHGDDKQTAGAIRHRLWTRYTSSDSPLATWVCCHGARAQLAVAAADAAAAAAANQNQAQVQVQDDPQDEEEEEEEGVDETRLVEMLNVYAEHFQKFQLIAFEKQCTELLRLCSNELIQVLGCRHPFDCAKNVLKNQSAEVIETATSLFEKCVSESNVQQLHLRRMKNLQKVHTSAVAHSLPFQLSQLYLSQQSESFKRMTVGTRVDTIVAALPSIIRVLCLHFSPDRCFLYAGLLGSTERRVAIARMEFTDTQTTLLEQLQKRIHAWRGKCAKETLAYEDAHGQNEIYEFMPAETQTLGSISRSDDVLEEEFTAIINDTVELLNPLFAHSSMKVELKNNLTGNTLVLLLDHVLACLPMEALPALQPADAIARDFSIQILHQRLMALKKQPLRPNEIRVIVDPHNEDPGNPTGQTLTSVVKQGGGGWKDAFEHGQIPSVTDWQHALLARRGGGLVYVGPNRVLGSCLPLQQVTGMNIALTCQAMILLDYAENAKSARRQSKLDSEKPAWEKEVECDPYARALLLTLCGVNVLAINQWETTFNGNRRLANGLLQNISKGYYVGKALKKHNETTIANPTKSTAPSMPIEGSATESTAAPASPTTGSDGSPTGRLQLKNRFRYNTVIYGLAHLTLKSGD